MTAPVKFYWSGQAGAPACTGTAGALITLLDAILKDGYNTKSVASITQAAGVATVTTSTNHGLAVGDPQVISGAGQAGYNGEFAVKTIVDATHFTLAVDAATVTPATGTISTKIAPAGWTKAFTGTNLAVYQSADSGSTQIPLRIDDTNAQYSGITGYLSMSDVNTGTESWFAAYWKKSSSSDSVARPWVAVADGKTLHLFIGWNQTVGSTPMYSHYVFGDLASYVTSDAYAAMLCAHSANNPGTLGTDTGTLAAGNIGSALSTSAGVKVARSLFGSAASARYLRAISAAGGLSVGNNASGADSNSFGGVQIADNGLHFVPVLLTEYDAGATKYPLRGESRGHYHILENLPAVGVNGFTLLSGLAGLTGRTMLLLRTGAGSTPTDCREGIDITGPWQ